MQGTPDVDRQSLLYRYIEFVKDSETYDHRYLVPDVGDGFTEQEVALIASIVDDQDAIEDTLAELRRAYFAELYKQESPGFNMHIIKEGGWFRLNLHVGTSIPYTITPPVLSTLATGRYPRKSEAVSVWEHGFFVGG